MLFKRLLATAAKPAAAAKAAAAPAATPSVVDVLVVGAGPAGLTLSAALKDSRVTRHLKIALIEGFDLSPVARYAEDPACPLTNRISSLTPQSVEYLRKIGSWKFINQGKIQPYDHIVVTEGLSDAQLDFGAPAMATMCENINLQSSLYQRIRELEHNGSGPVQIVDKTRVVDITTDPADHWPTVHLSNGQQLKARLLVGADGFNSPVRKFAGIHSDGWFYERFGVVATLQLEYPPFTATAFQRFLPSGPIALLPLPGDQATMVWAQSIEMSKLLTEIDQHLFVSLVNAAFVLQDVDLEYYYGKIRQHDTAGLIDDINWRVARALQHYSDDEIDAKFPVKVVGIHDHSRARFPLRLSHASTYVGERVALVGDAAHTTHPLAGQGLNMGQGDVQALVHAIEKGVQRGLDIGNPLVLEPYWSERYFQNNLLLGVVDKLHKLYSTKFEPVVALRSLGVKAFNQLGFLKDLMVKQVSGK